jgi:hypothetical protein
MSSAPPSESRPPIRLDEDTTPLVLFAGTVVGLALVVTGVVLTVRSWSVVVGGLEEWRKNWWVLLLCELSIFGGLAVMLLALQLARSQERINPGMRRLLYGYNAALTSLLLLTILAHLNVFAYLPLRLDKLWLMRAIGGLLVLGAVGVAAPAWLSGGRAALLKSGWLVFLCLIFLVSGAGLVADAQFTPDEKISNPINATYDWTESTLYTLSPESQAFLEKLDKPVRIYVLIPSRNFFLHHEVETLLDNCRRVTNKIQVEELSPDLSRSQILNLIQKYELTERQGLLLLYGPEGEEKSEFIKEDELFTVKQADFRNPDEKPRVQFTGESALIGKLSFLVENKARPVIYFTQGNGELDLDNSSESGREDVGVGRLRERLTRANYDIKPLKLGFGEDKVPEDAAIVVVARPSTTLAAPALNALREYLKPTDPKKKQGKLIVLFDVVKDGSGAMVHTGLEELLRQEYGVQVDDDRLICLASYQQGADPLDLIVTGNPASENPIVSPRYNHSRPVPLYDARTVEQAAPAGAAPPKDYRVESLLLAPTIQLGIIKETNLNADPSALAKSLLRPENEKDLRPRLSQQPFPVAVAVSELGAPKDRNDPHAFMRGDNREQQPRLVVFGDASWIANRRMSETGDFPLFSGTLAWLRDKPDVAVTTQAKERKPYYLVGGDNPADLAWRLWSMPVTVIGLGIVTLGAGVWVVRRR